MIEQLTKVIIPKLIDRMKMTEAALAGVQKQVQDLQDQIKILHEAGVKKATRSSRRKVEVPELLPVQSDPPQPEVLPSPPISETAPDNTPAAPVVQQSVITGVAAKESLTEGTFSEWVLQSVSTAVQSGMTDVGAIADMLGVPVGMVQSAVNSMVK